MRVALAVTAFDIFGGLGVFWREEKILGAGVLDEFPHEHEDALVTPVR